MGRCPWKGNGNSLQYSCLENPVDRGDWWATVSWVTKVRQDWVTEKEKNVQTSFRKIQEQKPLRILALGYRHFQSGNLEGLWLSIIPRLFQGGARPIFSILSSPFHPSSQQPIPITHFWSHTDSGVCRLSHVHKYPGTLGQGIYVTFLCLTFLLIYKMRIFTASSISTTFSTITTTFKCTHLTEKKKRMRNKGQARCQRSSDLSATKNWNPGSQDLVHPPLISSSDSELARESGGKGPNTSPWHKHWGQSILSQVSAKHSPEASIATVGSQSLDTKFSRLLVLRLDPLITKQTKILAKTSYHFSFVHYMLKILGFKNLITRKDFRNQTVLAVWPKRFPPAILQ